MNRFITSTTQIYDFFASNYEAKFTSRLLSNFLVLVFIGTLITAALNAAHIDLKLNILLNINFFSAITVCFNFLLFYETIGLVFIVSTSIANSIGKQFEILSLTLLRTSFEEFAHFQFDKSLVEQMPAIYKMASDGISAIIIFGMVHIYYQFQHHRQITQQLNEKEEFIKTKKIVALLILFSFAIIAFLDAIKFLKTGHFVQSTQLFYLILIFADMLFMLIALRYVIHYPNIFRYSAFVLLTIFVRMSLLAPVYYNGIIGVCSVAFSILLVYLYNKFFESSYFETKKVPKI